MSNLLKESALMTECKDEKWRRKSFLPLEVEQTIFQSTQLNLQSPDLNSRHRNILNIVLLFQRPQLMLIRFSIWYELLQKAKNNLKKVKVNIKARIKPKQS